MINISGLWKSTDKNGDTMLSGTWGNVKIFIFKNTKKTNDKQPDFRLCISENENKDFKKSNADQSGDFGPFDTILPPG